MKKSTLRKNIISTVCAAFLLLTLGVTAFAKTLEDSAGNVFVAEKDAEWNVATAREAFILGDTISLYDDQVVSNAALVGREIKSSTIKVGGSLWAFCRKIDLGLTIVGGNIYLMGGEIDTNSETVCGRLNAFTSTAHIDGEYQEVRINGSNVTFGACVEGDVYIQANAVTIEDSAVIKGKLTVISDQRPVISDDAQIGDFDYQKSSETRFKDVKLTSVGFLLIKMAHKIWKKIYWIIAALLMGLLLTAFADRHIKEAGKIFMDYPLMMCLKGFLFCILTPIAIIVLIISYFGIPIALLLLTIYIILIVLGHIFTGCFASRLVFPKMNRYLSAIIGIAIFSIVNNIPVIGLITSLLADLYFMGYFACKIWNRNGIQNDPERPTIHANSEQAGMNDRIEQTGMNDRTEQAGLKDCHDQENRKE